MSFKTNILKKYLKNKQIYHIISHDSWVYLKKVLLYSILLWILFVLYYKINVYFNANTPLILKRIFWWIGLIVYIKFMISFLDIYLDWIILTHNGIIIFRWDWLLKYRTESIEREALESVSMNQNWILDIMFNKWDIKINRIDHTYIFNEIPNPAKQVKIILQTRDDVASDQDEEEEKVDKFDMLVDMLWDVLSDYAKKK